jgi:hypothetical protein
MSQQEATYEPLLQHLYHLLRMAEITRESGQQPTKRAVLQSTDVIEHMARSHGGQLHLLFAPQATYLQHQLLRGTQQVHEMAAAIGRELAALGVHEVVLQAGIKPDDLLALIGALATYGAAPLGYSQSASPSAKISLAHRDVANHTQPAEVDDEQPVEERVVRVCAGAMVAMELLYDGLRRGQWQAVRLVKLHIQRLIELMELAPDRLLSFTTALQRTDPPSLAIKGAILAMTTTRHLTQDRVTLRDVGMAAALLDTGLIRACGLMDHAAKRGIEFLPRPGEDALDRMPEATATMIGLWGQLTSASMRRALLAYEAHALMRRASRGMPYGGQMAPTQEAIIIALVRRYLELTALDLGAGKRRVPEEAIDLLCKESTTRLERALLQLFLHTIGWVTRGTPVQLTSGARGVALGYMGRERALAFPVVRLVYDAQGQALPVPIDVDLSEMRDESLRFGVVRGVVRGSDARLMQLHEQIRSQVAAGQPNQTPMFGLPHLGHAIKRPRQAAAANLPPSLDELADAPLIEGAQSVVLSENFRVTSPDISRTDAVRIVSGSALDHLMPLGYSSQNDATSDEDMDLLRGGSSLEEQTDDRDPLDLTGQTGRTGNTDQTSPSGRIQDSFHETSQRVMIANIPPELMVPLITGILPIPQPPSGLKEPGEEPPTASMSATLAPSQPPADPDPEPSFEGEATKIIPIPVEPPTRAQRRPLAPPVAPPGVEPQYAVEPTVLLHQPSNLDEGIDATNVLPTAIIANLQVHDRRDDE